MGLQALACVIISAVVLSLQKDAKTGESKLSLTVRTMLLNRNVIITGCLVFGGMYLTNMGILSGVNFVFMNMIKSSKCLSVMVLTWLFPPKGGKRLVGIQNIIFGCVITVGLVMFNMKVRIYRQ